MEEKLLFLRPRRLLLTLNASLFLYFLCIIYVFFKNHSHDHSVGIISPSFFHELILIPEPKKDSMGNEKVQVNLTHK